MSLNLLNNKRNKEITEEDNDIRRRVIANLKKQVEQFDESEKVKPMEQISFVDSAKFEKLYNLLFAELEKLNQEMLTFMNDLDLNRENIAIKLVEQVDLSKIIIYYNSIISIYKNPRTTQTFRNMIITKLTTILGILNNALNMINENMSQIVDITRDIDTKTAKRILIENFAIFAPIHKMYNDINNKTLDYVNRTNLGQEIKKLILYLEPEKRDFVLNSFKEITNEETIKPIVSKKVEKILDAYEEEPEEEEEELKRKEEEELKQEEIQPEEELKKRKEDEELIEEEDEKPRTIDRKEFLKQMKEKREERKKKSKAKSEQLKPVEEPKPEGKGRRNRFNMRFGGLQSLYDDNY